MQSYLGDASLKVKRERSKSPQPSKRTRKKSVDIGDIDVEDGDDQSVESTSNQLVLYNPDTINTSQDVLEGPDHDNHAPSYQSFLSPNPSSRVLPSVGAFTVQCAACFKWRLIPTKEKYQEIRERILQRPFVCDRAREWRPDISCDDPADISQDGSRLWAIDKPNIAQPPPGWERLLRIRGEGSTKFADVYYVAPSGKRLRSTVEVEKYLFEHPEYIRQGVSLSQFSFQTPRPLQENYVRKRPARVTNTYADAGLEIPTPLEPVEVNPLSWAEPPTRRDLQIGPGLSTRYIEPPVYHSPEPPPPMKKKKKETRPSSKQMYSSPVYNQPKSNLTDSQQERYTSSYEL